MASIDDKKYSRSVQNSPHPPSASRPSTGLFEPAGGRSHQPRLLARPPSSLPSKPQETDASDSFRSNYSGLATNIYVSLAITGEFWLPRRRLPRCRPARRATRPAEPLSHTTPCSARPPAGVCLVAFEILRQIPRQRGRPSQAGSRSGWWKPLDDPAGSPFTSTGASTGGGHAKESWEFGYVVRSSAPASFFPASWSGAEEASTCAVALKGAKGSDARATPARRCCWWRSRFGPLPFVCRHLAHSAQHQLTRLSSRPVNLQYQARHWAVPSTPLMSRLPLVWIWDAIKVPERELPRMCGLDHTVHVRYLRCCCESSPDASPSAPRWLLTSLPHVS